MTAALASGVFFGTAVTLEGPAPTSLTAGSSSGYPGAVIVPHWAGIASIKWVGQIEVSATPLVSYWNTQTYRLFGPANQEFLLTGRSWSGSGPITRTEISIDGGRRWHPAIPRDPGAAAAWQRWEFRWRTPGPGSYTLPARATDLTDANQPATVSGNTFGYHFSGIAEHPVSTA